MGIVTCKKRSGKPAESDTRGNFVLVGCVFGVGRFPSLGMDYGSSCYIPKVPLSEGLCTSGSLEVRESLG